MYFFYFNKNKIIFAESAKILEEINCIIINSNKPSQIITLNSLIYLQSKFDYYTKKAVENAKLIICDSFGISLCCSLLSFKILKNQPGVELLEDLFFLSKNKNYKIFLFGSSKEVLEVLSKKLKEKGINIVGTHHGYIFHPKDLTDNVVNFINQSSPDILLVGLPTELQESWIYKNLNRLKCKVVVGVGGSFDVLSGKLKRAPKLFRILGLEWYFRTLQEPWRIFRIIKLPLAIVSFIFDYLEYKLKL